VNYFPAFLNIKNRPVLLVGGGTVATRKARALLAAGARLTVVAPDLDEALAARAAAGEIRYLARRFSAGDVEGHWLVVSAANSAEVNRDVASAAEAARVFCNAVDDLEHCSYIVPAVVDRSPLLVAISSAGNAPVLARQIRARLEALLPTRLGLLAEVAGRWRSRVTSTLEDFASRRRFWEGIFDGRLASLPGNDNEADIDSAIGAALQHAQNHRAGAGMAWLVGAGPGDPELLTLKALQALQQADVVLHDRLIGDGILDLARRDAERVSVGKTPGCTENHQGQTNALLVSLVAAGKRVCRLKGGDPFIFGRGGEEIQALEDAGFDYVVVPGITAAVGAAAAAGIPLTHRDHAQSLTFLTGHGKDAVDNIDWPALARGRQTLAVYMGVRRFPDLMQKLTAHGRAADTPIAIIEKGTTVKQRVVRGSLGQLPLLAEAHKVTAPAILIVGEVARLGRRAAPALLDGAAGQHHEHWESAIKAVAP
jgi:uroporphyrin-III C-methyltransferase/precorrin-2 dehydrogenase/sirohydrochlorin ferrochelatase